MTGYWKNKSYLVVQILPDGKFVELTRDFVMRKVVRRRVVEKIVVPEGMVTNFASIPRLIWLLISPTGRYNYAACIHDWLYEVQDRPRTEADLVFREIMECSGVSPWRIFLMYWAVRLFGWYRWMFIRSSL